MPPMSRRIIWRLEALAYLIICAAVFFIPFRVLSRLGGEILKIIGPLSSKHHIAKTNINIAFPDLPESQKASLLKDQWENCGRTFAEFPALQRLKAFDPKSRITVDGLEILQTQDPAVIVTGHFANWEIMALVMTQAGLPVHITYRKINNPYIDAHIRRQRKAYGTKLLVQKSGIKGAKELLTAIENEQSVALLNDQKFNEGLSLPFFGQDAMTASGAVRLALKTNRPLVPLSLVRNGSHFHMTVHPPLELETSGPRHKDIEAGVLKINRFIETIIKARPEQWFWVHRRWPKPLYKDKS